eukprot:scaffold7272_cov124-Skeletonema_dohrnii-CCMP3373.AAC.5
MRQRRNFTGGMAGQPLMQAGAAYRRFYPGGVDRPHVQCMLFQSDVLLQGEKPYCSSPLTARFSEVFHDISFSSPFSSI